MAEIPGGILKVIVSAVSKGPFSFIFCPTQIYFQFDTICELNDLLSSKHRKCSTESLFYSHTQSWSSYKCSVDSRMGEIRSFFSVNWISYLVFQLRIEGETHFFSSLLFSCQFYTPPFSIWEFIWKKNVFALLIYSKYSLKFVLPGAGSWLEITRLWRVRRMRESLKDFLVWLSSCIHKKLLIDHLSGGGQLKPQNHSRGVTMIQVIWEDKRTSIHLTRDGELEENNSIIIQVTLTLDNAFFPSPHTSNKVYFTFPYLPHSLVVFSVILTLTKK